MVGVNSTTMVGVKCLIYVVQQCGGQFYTVYTYNLDLDLCIAVIEFLHDLRDSYRCCVCGCVYSTLRRQFYNHNH